MSKDKIYLYKETAVVITRIEIDAKAKKYNGELKYKGNGSIQYLGGLISNLKAFIGEKISKGFLIIN